MVGKASGISPQEHAKCFIDKFSCLYIDKSFVFPYSAAVNVSMPVIENFVL